jgi:hypothetical protein
MSPLKFSSLEVDIKAETDGEWIPIKKWIGLDPDEPYSVTDLPGIEFFVRSDNYQPYKVARQKLGEKLEETKSDYPDGIIPDDVADIEHGRIMAEHLLLGWKGFDVEYTPEMAMAALTKPAGRVHRQMVIFCARKVGRRKAEFDKDAAKNLGKSRPGR